MMKKCSIGGQGVLEGVMMRSPAYTGIAVRRESGEIVTQKKKNDPLAEKYKILGIPIIRGVVNFVEMLFFGVKTITDAAKLYDDTDEELKPSKVEEAIAKKTGKSSMDVAIFFAVIIALVLAIGLFFVLPNLITGWIAPFVSNPVAMNFIDGGVRICIFLAYLFVITMMPDIKRLFGYHGAEHKVINCYEHEKPMDTANAQSFTTRHPRCGTSFLLIVLIISILLFSVLGWNENPLLRILSRLAMLPVVAGVSYEVLKLVAKFENPLTRALRKPGMALQALTTREPDDGMIQCALIAFFIAENERTQEEIDAAIAEYSTNKEEEAQPTAEETQTTAEETQTTAEETQIIAEEARVSADEVQISAAKAQEEAQEQ